MFDRVLNVIKEKDIVIPRILLLNYKDIGISNDELIVLAYLMNSDSLYNPKTIASDLKLELVEVLNLISSLTEKGIIHIGIENMGNKKAEIIDIMPLYEKLSFLVVNDSKETDTTIYSVIEKEFARSLSPLEYDLVNAWIDNGYTEELIKEALKEAIYNNVTSLKYIDKILDNWSKKGIKNKKDVIDDQKKFKERKNNIKDSFDYDWLNEE